MLSFQEISPMQKLQLKDKYDVLIIGAGISGLTSAALYSRFGMSVCLLEMDARPGGYLAGFRRNDFRFDSAIHWLNQCGPIHPNFDGRTKRNQDNFYSLPAWACFRTPQI